LFSCIIILLNLLISLFMIRGPLITRTWISISIFTRSFRSLLTSCSIFFPINLACFLIHCIMSSSPFFLIRCIFSLKWIISRWTLLLIWCSKSILNCLIFYVSYLLFLICFFLCVNIVIFRHPLVYFCGSLLVVLLWFVAFVVFLIILLKWFFFLLCSHLISWLLWTWFKLIFFGYSSGHCL
jgi:hypothetical protein